MSTLCIEHAAYDTEVADDDLSRSDIAAGRDRPLSFRWKANYNQLRKDLPLPSCKTRKGERAMASIVVDAALSAAEDPARRISYSRRKDYYLAARRYFGTDYGYDTVVHAVDALVETGILIDHQKMAPKVGGSGIQSSFRPDPALAEILLPHVDYTAGELIRLKDVNGNLVRYLDTAHVQRNRTFLKAVNDHIAGSKIELPPIPKAIFDPVRQTIFFEGLFQWLPWGNGDHTVYTHMVELYRVYKGGWTSGGRLYGGWWQQLRKIHRDELLIDGCKTVEVDYAMLHPRLVYALADREVDGDAYFLAGWERASCKRAFNILLNANNYAQALGAIANVLDGSYQRASMLIDAMKHKHSSVAEKFHTGAGLKLQYIDSEMACQVLLDLTLRRNITVLPIHDSFIVKAEHKSVLEEAMDRAFLKVTASKFT